MEVDRGCSKSSSLLPPAEEARWLRWMLRGRGDPSIPQGQFIKTAPFSHRRPPPLCSAGERQEGEEQCH